jgi:hypothetical protein
MLNVEYMDQNSYLNIFEMVASTNEHLKYSFNGNY